jgi:hypothetical protein
MKRPSRRATTIAAISAGTVVVLVAGAIVGLNVKADTDARGSYSDAVAELAAAVTALNTARRDYTIAQQSAGFTVRDADALAVAAEPALIADPATVEALQAAVATLATVAGLLDTEGALTVPEPLPRATVPNLAAPDTRGQYLASAASARADASELAAESIDLAAETELITASSIDVDAAATAVAASAFTFGSAAVPPARASADSVAAFAAAVAALEAPTADADITALVVAYRDAWHATVASDAATRSGSGAAAPTYIKGILIVNKTYALPSTFGSGLTTETSNSFAAMQAAAAAAGHNIYISSGFRSFASQTSIYNRYKANEGQAGADTHSARPGHSEHQSGLAFDLNTITQAFGSTPEGVWTAQNAHLYGFIVRYPQGKESITGYIWEPWHLRYVGVDVATELYTSGQTLEEYLGVTSVYS